MSNATRAGCSAAIAYREQYRRTMRAVDAARRRAPSTIESPRLREYWPLMAVDDQRHRDEEKWSRHFLSEQPHAFMPTASSAFRLDAQITCSDAALFQPRSGFRYSRSYRCRAHSARTRTFFAEPRRQYFHLLHDSFTMH